MERSEEDAALFWSVDMPTDPVSGGMSADQTLEATEATPTGRLWPETITLSEQVTASKMPTVRCSMKETTPAATAQDTKPAMQSQATSMMDVDEISGEKTIIPMLHQITTGTQTESRNSLLDAEALSLKETLREETSSNPPIETMSSG